MSNSQGHSTKSSGCTAGPVTWHADRASNTAIRSGSTCMKEHTHRTPRLSWSHRKNNHYKHRSSYWTLRLSDQHHDPLPERCRNPQHYTRMNPRSLSPWPEHPWSWSPSYPSKDHNNPHPSKCSCLSLPAHPAQQLKPEKNSTDIMPLHMSISHWYRVLHRYGRSERSQLPCFLSPRYIRQASVQKESLQHPLNHWSWYLFWDKHPRSPRRHLFHAAQDSYRTHRRGLLPFRYRNASDTYPSCRSHTVQIWPFYP